MHFLKCKFPKSDEVQTAFATEAELFAAADRYRLNVLVKSSVQKDSGWNEHKPTVKGRGCREIRLLHTNEHFNLLEVSGKEEMQIEEKAETVVTLGSREADVQKIDWFESDKVPDKLGKDKETIRKRARVF